MLPARFNPFSFRSPSKRPGGSPLGPQGCRFNPFSFRSPSKHGEIVGLPAPEPVSIPSPSGLLQNSASFTHWYSNRFQSLLLQVSFKTTSSCGSTGGTCFNPFSFRSPSKRPGGSPLGPQGCRFNPFSFRSPSKRWSVAGITARPGFNPFSFRSPSKRGIHLTTKPENWRFNPFSFRSPSKRPSAPLTAA